ncbi:unnamed protein product [Toxocara canis]|uniref:Calponin-homology (CH) domain-containing protein n=1 Tax=Toxocara canis TaxID=6265 RepID=A0A183V8E7_TOXCA|nr:unnamed protein product [Toxocara canis]
MDREPLANRTPFGNITDVNESGRETLTGGDAGNVSAVVEPGFMSSTFVRTPRFSSYKEWRESAILNTTTKVIEARRYLDADDFDKENESSFAVPSLPPHEHVRSSSLAMRSPRTAIVKRRAESASSALSGDTEATLRISPGTGASDQKMAMKLAALRKRDNERKAKKASERASSKKRSRIDLTLTARRFLNGASSRYEPMSPAVFRNMADAKVDNMSVTSAILNATNEVSSRTAIINDATYTVSKGTSGRETCSSDITFPLARESPTDDICDVEERSRQHIKALTAWLNYLLRTDFEDDESFHETAARNKIEADRHLRELLTADLSGKSVRTHVSAENTGFNFKTFFADARMAAIRRRCRQLYKESDIPRKIVALVEEQKIAVVPDRKVFCHLGLQTKLLKLLLDFEPFWLRLGLETVFGVEIDIPTKESFRPAIVTFIAQRLFRDPAIMRNRKYVQGRAM